jgi:hypothetical protein
LQVTPDQARRWLINSWYSGDPQRHVDQRKVEALVSKITNGKWEDLDPQTRYQPVRIRQNGYIIDGHHRLFAVSLAETAAEMEVFIL